MKRSSPPKTTHPTGPAAIDSYLGVMAMLADRGAKPAELLFIRNVEGVEALFQTMSAVNAAMSGASDEEWNPLSQRPHSPLAPNASPALGREVWTLKHAIDAFTTLGHEMMHVALWEPFFTGRWKPKGQKDFIEFSLLAEGYSFFFSDIVVTRAIRQRLPDGEYALERHTNENAFFHPIRAFQALNIESIGEILDVYLEGFRGHKTRIWQPKGGSIYAGTLAAQVNDFYQGSILPLHELHQAISSFGGLSEFYKRFCAIEGLPTFLVDDDVAAPGGKDLKDYFVAFHASGLKTLSGMTQEQIAQIRRRRALQMRAYYAMQVRWVLAEGLILTRNLTAAKCQKLVAQVDDYLSAIELLLKSLAETPDLFSTVDLARLDASYDVNVRAALAKHDVWVAQRWMIVPRRAGGFISASKPGVLKDRDAKITLLRLSAYVVDELTRRMRQSKTIEERAAVMAHIQKIATLGAAGDGTKAQTLTALRKLSVLLGQEHLRGLWSVPLTTFNPAANEFRELVCSYQ